MQRSEVLFLCFLNPFKEKADGGAQDIKRRIISLAEQGYYVKVFALEKAENNTLIDIGCANIDIKIYDRKLHLLSFLWLKPYPILSRYNSELIDDLVFELKKPIHALVVEGIQCKAVFDNLPEMYLKKIPVILRVHNLENKYYREFSKSSHSLIKKIAYYLTSLQYKFIEKSFVDQFDHVHFISNDELEAYSLQSVFKKNVRWVPPIVNNIAKLEKTEKTEASFRLAYFGDLAIPLNFQGMEWFIRKVFSKLLSKFPYKLHIAGSGSEKFASIQGVETHGYVSDLPGFLSGTDLIVLPICHGAGVKIKTVDSLALGLPVVGTSIAFEGVSNDITQHCIIENSPQGIVSVIEDIRKYYPKYLENAKIAQEKVLCNFSPENYTKIIGQVSRN